ncbi:DUF177 domain-containing protein [Aquabacterium sp. A08]|uniref:YceD family protein n=1 Tax=Aquabacterium sp. A08 TaxID=2718532 RepID=UPI00141F0F67|nr:DUF177 domain-containing protein [Aquabacterium sp. A08]NIC43212.1 DUF177 domain-containing protein [Aquabacterium sp. A08]
MTDRPSSALPTQIDLKALARQGQPLAGVLPLSALARLAADAPALPGAAPADVQWQARAEFRERAPGEAAERGAGGPPLWLHLVLDAAVPQTCQRCLQPYAQPVQVDRWFRFVADEAAAEAQDDDCEEDLLVFEPRFNLLDLIEDELLMDLPLVPMHETCPTAVPMSAGALDEAGDAPRPHPFAALAALKPRPGGQGT